MHFCKLECFAFDAVIMPCGVVESRSNLALLAWHFHGYNPLIGCHCIDTDIQLEQSEIIRLHLSSTFVDAALCYR